MEFKTIEGYPYEIYEDGTVYRTERTSKTGRCLHKIKLRPYKLTNGYLVVRLYCTKDDTYRKFYLHRLVYMAFNGSIGNKLEVDHRDGDRSNNRLDNLKAVSHKENCANDISRARYRRANALSAHKFNREKMIAAQGKENHDRLVNIYQELKKKHGQVGIWMLMRAGNCGYPRSKRIVNEMEGRNDVNP